MISNPAHGEMYSIQYYVIKLLATGQWFSQGTPVYSINKTYLHDITEILLKVALNTITLAPLPYTTACYKICWCKVESIDIFDTGRQTWMEQESASQDWSEFQKQTIVIFKYEMVQNNMSSNLL